MHPLKRLKKLLATPTPTAGTLIDRREDGLIVATPQGMITVTPLPGDVTVYQVGDTVRLNQGQLVGRRLGRPPVVAV